MPNRGLHRRTFLSTTAAAVAAMTHGVLAANERPPVRNPRATDGDSAHEPNWEQQIQVTVGTKKGDLVGDSDRVLQAAFDYVARLGGGTVRVLPGVYTLRNAVFMPSKTRLLGSGADSVITKIPSQRVALAEDSDWYDQEVTLAKDGGFRVGDGVVFQAKNPHNGGQQVIKRTLVAQSGRRFKINDGLRENLWLSGKPTAASLFPLLTSEHTSDVVIENITLDGNKKNNENFNGNYGGCIFLQDCNRYTIRNVEAKNYNGDGVSFQICHDVVVENCYSHDNANLGVHPGSGSQRPIIRNCRLENNDQGLFWCWGVKYGLAEDNTMKGNRSYGTSIGHNDTDNVMRNNTIIDSGKIGVLFRDDSRGKDFWANRNTLVGNQILNSGGKNGVAIEIRGNTKDIVLTRNTIEEQREPAERIGISIHATAGKVTLDSNSIQGVAEEIVDRRQT